MANLTNLKIIEELKAIAEEADRLIAILNEIRDGLITDTLNDAYQREQLYIQFQRRQCADIDEWGNLKTGRSDD